jgi:hypothetical protein
MNWGARYARYNKANSLGLQKAALLVPRRSAFWRR